MCCWWRLRRPQSLPLWEYRGECEDLGNGHRCRRVRCHRQQLEVRFESCDVSANGATTISVIPGTAAHATMLKLVSGNNQSADQRHHQHPQGEAFRARRSRKEEVSSYNLRLLQPFGEFASRSKPVDRLARERASHRRFHRRRNGRAQNAHRRRGHRRTLARTADTVAPVKGGYPPTSRTTHCQVRRHRCERQRRIRRPLLRAHVLRRSQRQSRFRQARSRLAHRQCDSEVGDQRVPIVKRMFSGLMSR